MRRLLLLGLIAIAACSDSTSENSESLPQVLDLQTSWSKSCVLIEGGELWCWGVVPSVSDYDAPSLTPVRVPVPGTVTSFALSGYSICAATDAGATYCAGGWVEVDVVRSYGEGMALLQDSLPLHGLNASDYHVCGVTEAEHLVCWGSKTWGARGEGAPDTTESNTILNQVAGDDPYVEVAASGASSCGIRTDRTMACWGLLSRLGTTPPAGLISRTCYFNTQDCVWTPVLFPLSNIEQVSDTCVRAGTIRCWGEDAFGNPRPTATVMPMPEGAKDLSGICALGQSGKAYCWAGYATPALGHHLEDGQPHPVETDLRFERISARGTSCGLTKENAVYCWGEGYYGMIGDGDTTSTYTPRRVTPAWAGN